MADQLSNPESIRSVFSILVDGVPVVPVDGGIEIRSGRGIQTEYSNGDFTLSARRESTPEFEQKLDLILKLYDGQPKTGEEETLYPALVNPPSYLVTLGGGTPAPKGTLALVNDRCFTTMDTKEDGYSLKLVNICPPDTACAQAGAALQVLQALDTVLEGGGCTPTVPDAPGTVRSGPMETLLCRMWQEARELLGRYNDLIHTLSLQLSAQYNQQNLGISVWYDNKSNVDRRVTVDMFIKASMYRQGENPELSLGTRLSFRRYVKRVSGAVKMHGALGAEDGSLADVSPPLTYFFDQEGVPDSSVLENGELLGAVTFGTSFRLKKLNVLIPAHKDHTLTFIVDMVEMLDQIDAFRGILPGMTHKQRMAYPPCFAVFEVDAFISGTHLAQPEERKWSDIYKIT